MSKMTAPNEYLKSATKPIIINGGFPTPTKIFSEKYQCWLTESLSYFDASQNSWVNEKIKKINTLVKL